MSWPTLLRGAIMGGCTVDIAETMIGIGMMSIFSESVNEKGGVLDAKGVSFLTFTVLLCLVLLVRFMTLMAMTMQEFSEKLNKQARMFRVFTSIIVGTFWIVILSVGTDNLVSSLVSLGVEGGITGAIYFFSLKADKQAGAYEKL